MNIIVGGSGFVGSRLKSALEESRVFDKVLKQGEVMWT